MLPGKKFTPEEIIGIARRRWWLILLPFLVGTAAGVLAYQRIPVKYQSETLIMVVPQRIPSRIVETQFTSIEERLPTISDQIMSRSRLERVIADFNLYPEQRARGMMESVVEQMRNDIDVRLEAKDLFRVSYKNASQTTAQSVAERLASLYIEENLRDRENLTASTSKFIQSQLDIAREELLKQEKQLEQYSRIHAGQLPTQLSSNLQGMQNAQMQLQVVGDAINRARERRLLIERQLADTQTLPAAVVVSGVATPSDEPSQLAPAQQLEVERSRLDALLLRLTKDHPDVRALERTIRDLRARADEEAKRAHAADRPLSTTEAGRQKKLGDLQAELDVIDRQIATGQADEARLKGTIADYQARIDSLPKREAELVELTRSYKTHQESYAGLLTRLEEAKRAEALEQLQAGEQFKVLDPASFPEKPYNQKQRLVAMAGGAFGGLALGLVLVGLLEYRDSTFKVEDDVLRVLELPVLALVPIMASASEALESQRRKRKLLAGSIALVLAVGSAVALTFWRLQP